METTLPPDPISDFGASGYGSDNPDNAPDEQPPLKLSRNLILLWLGQFISSLGDWCLWIAIPITVYNRTNSRIDLAFTLFTEALPYLIFSPIAGVLVDRTDRRKTMIAADVSRALLVGLLAVPFFLTIPLWEYYAVLFCASACSAFFMPARIVVMTQVVPQRQLLRVNTLLASSIQLSETIGPAMAGFILFKFLQRGAFLIDAATFVVSALCIAGLTVSAIPPAREAGLTLSSVLEDMRTGPAIIWKTGVLRGLLISWNVGFVATAIFTALTYAYARDVLQLAPERYGLMMSFIGLGFLGGGMLLGLVLHECRPARLMPVGLAISSASALAFAFSRTLPEGCTALFTFGLAASFVTIPAQTLVQTLVKQDMLGRFGSAFSMVARIAQVIGAAAAGFLATALTLSKTYIIVAAGYLLSAVIAWCLLYMTPTGVAAESAEPSSLEQSSGAE